MKAEYTTIPLYNNEAQKQYELLVEEQTSIVEYKQTNTHIYLLHTEIPQHQEGRGIPPPLLKKYW